MRLSSSPIVTGSAATAVPERTAERRALMVLQRIDSLPEATITESAR